MAAWSGDVLDRLGNAEEVQVSFVRSDGSHGDPVTIWAVREGDDLYVRSVRGTEGGWFRGVQRTHQGRISAGRVHHDVMFAAAGDEVQERVDAAYRAKYRRYAGRILNSVLTPEARSSTLRLDPR